MTEREEESERGSKRERYEERMRMSERINSTVHSDISIAVLAFADVHDESLA